MNKTGPGAFSMIEHDHVQTDGITEEDILRMLEVIGKELFDRTTEAAKPKRDIAALEALKFE